MELGCDICAMPHIKDVKLIKAFKENSKSISPFAKDCCDGRLVLLSYWLSSSQEFHLSCRGIGAAV